MAAYRGAPYIGAQLDSLVAQTYPNWTVRVRDDCSDDGTYDTARRSALQHPERIRVERRQANSGSAARNFLELLASSSEQYVMFADDDDVWLADKVAVTLTEMRRIERDAGPGVPVLVHTDLSVVDAALNVVDPSMARSQRLAVRETRLARLLVQNSVTGCTVMVNRALADLAGEPSDEIAMHDWWLALLAAAFGRIGYVPRPTVLYRQHGRNAVGAADARSARYLVGRALGGDETRARMRTASRQAAELLRRHGDTLTAEQRLVVAACARLRERGKVAGIAGLVRHGLWKNTALRRLGQVWYV